MTVQTEALIDRRRLRRKLSFWRIAAFLVALIAIIGGFSILAGGPNSILQGDHIARVEITGLITDDRVQQKMLESIRDNDHAKALLLAIDSPGGTTTGSEALYGAIRSVAEKKPVVASLGTIAASGGYIAAIGADHIVARRNTLAGSIGVLIQWPNATGLLGRVGVEFKSVKSSPIKAEPTPFTDAPPEAIAALEDVVTDSYDWFIKLVRERRNMTIAESRIAGDARIFTGNLALEVKLVDEIGGEDVAQAWLSANRDIQEDLEMKTYRPRDSLDRLSGANFLGRILGLAGLSALVPDSAALDGLVSVWHPDAVH